MMTNINILVQILKTKTKLDNECEFYCKSFQELAHCTNILDSSTQDSSGQQANNLYGSLPLSHCLLHPSWYRTRVSMTCVDCVTLSWEGRGGFLTALMDGGYYYRYSPPSPHTTPQTEAKKSFMNFLVGSFLKPYKQGVFYCSALKMP